MLGLRANVTQEEAFRAFRANSPANLYWRATRGPLQRLALAYVPFRLYHVHYQLGAAKHSRYFAIDRVQGILDLFEFPAEPPQARLTETTPRSHIAPGLSDDQTEKLLHEKVLRVIFQQGFFRVRDTRLQAERTLDLNMPYWLAFYGTDGSLRCRVMDAIRRRMEGPKSTLLFESWLSAPQVAAAGNSEPAKSLS